MRCVANHVWKSTGSKRTTSQLPPWANCSQLAESSSQLAPSFATLLRPAGHLASTARRAAAGWKCVHPWLVGRRLSDLLQLPTNIGSVDGWDGVSNKYSLFHATHYLPSTTHCLNVTQPAWARAYLLFRWEAASSGFRDWQDFGIGIGIKIPSGSRDCNL